MRAKDCFYIKKFTNRTGSLSWRVQGRSRDGTLVRKNFRVYEEAIAEKHALEIQVLNQDNTIRLVNTRLSPAQLSEAEAAFKMLGEKTSGDGVLKGKSLLQILDYGLKNYRDPLQERVVADVVQDFLDAKGKENRRARTLANLRSRLNCLAGSVGTKLVSQVTAADLHPIIFSDGTHPVTQTHRLSVFKSFFNWCQRRGYASANPANALNAPEYDQGEPEILSIDEVRALLRAAMSYKAGKLVPYLCIGLFGGLRPAELARVTWEVVSLETKLIRLAGSMAKKRQRRNVELAENAIQWLRPFQGATVVAPNWRRDFDAVRRLAGFRGSVNKTKADAGLKPWPSDVIRHTAISAHLAMYEHEGKTARWAGNSPDVIHTHYNGLMTHSDAEIFWSLTPDNLDGVVISVPAVA